METTTIEIKRWDNGNVIFSHTCKNNTLVHTITEAIKQGVSLSYADLHNNILNFINFTNADLSYANFNNCSLVNSVLVDANITKADFTNADLTYADVSYEQLAIVKGVNDQCPKEGSFIGWKKCFDRNNKTFCVVKLEIPADARRCSGTTNKCRCSKAKVLEIQNIDGTIADTTVVCSSFYSSNIVHYKINEIIYPNWFDDYFWNECSNGIHFFMDRDEAINYF